MATNKNTSLEASLAEKLAAGTQKHLSTVGQIIVVGGTYTPAQIVAQLDTLSALRAAVDAARAGLKGRLEDERSKGPALVAFLQAFEGVVRSAFGGQPDVLSDFGLAPRKPRTPLTTAQKAAAEAKSKATRQARGTKGKKQRLAIKGNVTGVVVSPVTEPPPVQPVTPAQPAAPAQPSLPPALPAASTVAVNGAAPPH